jgi:hypothetical protein
MFRIWNTVSVMKFETSPLPPGKNIKKNELPKELGRVPMG